MPGKEKSIEERVQIAIDEFRRKARTMGILDFKPVVERLEDVDATLQRKDYNRSLFLVEDQGNFLAQCKAAKTHGSRKRKR